jgi:hypothetical protein
LAALRFFKQEIPLMVSDLELPPEHQVYSLDGELVHPLA